MNAQHRVLAENLKRVEARICEACLRAGRARTEVTLVAVTKTVTAGVASWVHELGIRDLAENRPQELWKKSEVLPPSITWHMIGHLQRNKIERTLPLVRWIHSVDSLRLLESLDREAAKQDRTTEVFLEVNTSGENTKQGFQPQELRHVAELFPPWKSLRIRGLMTMAALQDPEACRPGFRLLRTLRDELAKVLGPQHPVEHLSMGMSNDFEVAIEEGATMIRLGTVLFQGMQD